MIFNKIKLIAISIIIFIGITTPPYNNISIAQQQVNMTNLDQNISKTTNLCSVIAIVPPINVTTIARCHNILQDIQNHEWVDQHDELQACKYI